MKLRRSTAGRPLGTLYYQVIYDRVVRQVPVGVRLAMEDWDGDNCCVHASNAAVCRRVEVDVDRLQGIVVQLEQKSNRSR